MTLLRNSDTRVNTMDHDRRKSQRLRALRSCIVNWQATRYLGVVRDLSEEGLFFFSHFDAGIGDHLRIEIDRSLQAPMVVTGTVVRKEQHFPSGMIGITVRLAQSIKEVTLRDLAWRGIRLVEPTSEP